MLGSDAHWSGTSWRARWHGLESAEHRQNGRTVGANISSEAAQPPAEAKRFSAVIETLRQLAPQDSTLLDWFSETETTRILRLPDKTRENLAQQKEAVLTALSIAGLGRDPVQEWVPSDETPVSFLDGLPSARLREDQMVVKDLQNLQGFEVVKTYPYSAAVFKSEKTSERLTVILANRLPLDIQGPRGGLRITCENAKRYFDNTAFATVVSKAWVGTTPSQSQVLQDVIRATLETGKAVAIAIKPKTSKSLFTISWSLFNICSQVQKTVSCNLLICKGPLKIRFLTQHLSGVFS